MNDMDSKTKQLIREARRLLAAYTDATDTIRYMDMDVALDMARASFYAHSIHRGYNPDIVAQVRDKVFGAYSEHFSD